MIRQWRMALSLLLVGAAALYLGMTAAQRAAVPDEADLQAAAATVRAGWQEGDLAIFSPAWAHAGAPYLQGLDVDIAELPDFYEAAKHPRVWVVAQAPAREPVPPEGWTAVQRVEHGRVTVHLWARPDGTDLLWDARRAIQTAKVSHGVGTARQACTTFRDGRWSCGGAHPWQNVGPMARDIAGRVRRVLWAHARDNGDPLEVRWTDVPAGRTLTVHLGLTQRAVEQDTGAPVVVEVRVNDRVVATRTIAIGEAGWFRHDVDVSGLGPLDLAVRIVAAKNQDRQLCFTADVWK
jgi:hypothetical protein